MVKNFITAIIQFIFTPVWVVKQLNRHLKINKWQKALKLEEHQQLFTALYYNVDGYDLSRQARLRQDAIEYTYGEIKFLPFIALLSLVKPDKNTVFYDLGCGIGKAVIACALVYPVKKSVGVEILEELASCAKEKVQLLAEISGSNAFGENIEIIQADFFSIDLLDANLMLINATTFFGPTWDKLGEKLNKLTDLKTVITTSRPLKTCTFEVITTTKIQMSWGVVPAFIHQRKN